MKNTKKQSKQFSLPVGSTSKIRFLPKLVKIVILDFDPTSESDEEAIKQVKAWFKIYSGKIIEAEMVGGHPKLIGKPEEDWKRGSAYAYRLEPTEFRFATPADFLKERIQKYYEETHNSNTTSNS